MLPTRWRQTARPRGRIEEAARRGEEIRHVQQKGVVAAICLDLDERDGRGRRIERMDNRA
jgi:hypothetical protein